eukprot:g2079.t1
MFGMIKNRDGNQDYLMKSIVPTLLPALTQLALLRPADPLVWLGHFVLQKSGKCNRVVLADGTSLAGGAKLAKGVVEERPRTSQTKQGERPTLRAMEARTDSAAITVQSYYRGYSGRSRLKREGLLRPEKELSLKEKVAAIFREGDQDGDGRWNLDEANRINALLGESPMSVKDFAELCAVVGDAGEGGLTESGVFSMFDLQQDSAAELNKAYDILVTALNSARGPNPNRVKSAEEAAKIVKLPTGAAVEAQYRGESMWFPAVITAVNGRLNTYDLKYEMGKVEKSVARNYIRPRIEGIAREAEEWSERKSNRNGGTQLECGSRVECNFEGSGEWYKGKIESVNDNGTYNITYDDGDKESNVKKSFIRLLTVPANDLNIGDRIKARFGGDVPWNDQRDFFPGKIVSINGDGTYAVDFDDGDKQESVKREHIKKLSSEEEVTSEIKQWQVDEKIEARYAGKEEYFSGKIVAVHNNNTYDILYDDGDRESNVSQSLIRSLAASTKNKDKDVTMQEKAEAVFQAGDKDRDGIWNLSEANLVQVVLGETSISAEDFAELCAVVGDNSAGGLTAQGVRSMFDMQGDPAALNEAYELLVLNKSDGKSTTEEQKVLYPVGAIVSVLMIAGERQNAKVGRVHQNNNTYDVVFIEGDKNGMWETGVPISRIQAIDEDKSTNNNVNVDQAEFVFQAGNNGEPWDLNAANRINVILGEEAMKKEDFTELCAVVDCVPHIGMTFDGVRKMFEMQGDPSVLQDAYDLVKKAMMTNSSSKSFEFEIGSEVEVNYAGKGQWFKGRIEQVNESEEKNVGNTFDILYDDGDRERGVKLESIRRVEDVSGATFPIDTKVEAQYGDGQSWYPAKISKVASDGEGGFVYDLIYSDGDKESKKVARKIRLRKSLPGAKQNEMLNELFSFGDKDCDGVWNLREANWINTVLGEAPMSTDDLNDLCTDVGDSSAAGGLTITGVTEMFLRQESSDDLLRAHSLVKIAADAEKAIDVLGGYQVGMRIEARFNGGDEYFPGIIQGVNNNGSFNILFDDGDRSLGVNKIFMKPAGENQVLNEENGNKRSEISQLESENVNDEKEKSTFPTEKEFETSQSHAFTVGDVVEARYGGEDRWFGGVIERVHSNSTFDIKYDDGDEEASVAKDLIRLPLKGGGIFQSGDVVECLYGQGNAWFPGRIDSVNANGTYKVLYDDGDIEEEVQNTLIRRPGGQRESTKDNIGAENETDEESKMQDITAAEAAREAANEALALLEKEEAETELIYEEKHHRGVIPLQARHRGRSVRRRYSDELESKRKERIKRMAKEENELENDKLPGKETEVATFAKGELIEAMYDGDNGSGEWFPGVISHVELSNNNEALYDIKYNDGDEEKAVASRFIRYAPPVGGTFLQGEAVEARYGGGNDFYPGMISKVNEVGDEGKQTYGIMYYDGDVEDAVPAELIRKSDNKAAEAAKAAAAAANLDENQIEGEEERLFEGTAVRVCRGDTEDDWKSGEIKKVREKELEDGGISYSYDILFDDGERESKVELEEISVLSPEEAVEAAAQLAGGNTMPLEPGMTVEALYEAGNRWFPGNIGKKNDDETYQIIYHDGDIGDNVSRELIRLSLGTRLKLLRLGDGGGK